MKKQLIALVLLAMFLNGCQQRAEILMSYETQPTTQPATTAAMEVTTAPMTAPITIPTEPTAVPTEAVTEPNKKDVVYVLNMNSEKFHYPDCSSVKQIKDSNRKDFTGSREELLERGFDPCKRCDP